MKKEDWIIKNSDYIHYLYKIVNKINGKYYYGIHSIPKDLKKEPENDGYWGSGVDIIKAIKSEGRDNFSKEIIKIFSTREELSKAENEIVTIEEVRNPMCYNLIVGGDSNPNHLGWVVCRPKSAIDKIITISREEYYSNKDLYIITGHLKYYLTGKGSSRSKGERSKKATRRKNRELGGYATRNTYINRNTLETIQTVGRGKPEELYEVWFPHYFFDKIHKKFIDSSHFKESYEKFTNIKDLAKYFGQGRKKIAKLRDYYTGLGIELEENTTKGKIKTTGFSGKAFIHLGNESKVVDKSEVDKYTSEGWKRGKAVSLTIDDVLEDFINRPSFREIQKKI